MLKLPASLGPPVQAVTRAIPSMVGQLQRSACEIHSKAAWWFNDIHCLSSLTASVLLKTNWIGLMISWEFIAGEWLVRLTQIDVFNFLIFCLPRIKFNSPAQPLGAKIQDHRCHEDIYQGATCRSFIRRKRLLSLYLWDEAGLNKRRDWEWMRHDPPRPEWAIKQLCQSSRTEHNSTKSIRAVSMNRVVHEAHFSIGQVLVEKVSGSSETLKSIGPTFRRTKIGSPSQYIDQPTGSHLTAT